VPGVDPREEVRIDKGFSMPEMTYLPEVECIVTHPDAILNLQVVAVLDEGGRRHSVFVPKGEVTQEGGKSYLPIWVVEFDFKGRRALVELPSESGSGTRRLWVPLANFRPYKVLSEREIQALRG
jgi:hypothetical protein